MKFLNICLLQRVVSVMLVALWSSVLYAQDRIVMCSGQEIPSVQVRKITESTIEYSYVGEDLVNEISIGNVLKIIFQSGREQFFVCDNHSISARLPKLFYSHGRYRGGDLVMKRKEYRHFLEENCPEAAAMYHSGRSWFVAGMITVWFFWPMGIIGGAVCSSKEDQALNIYNSSCATE